MRNRTYRPEAPPLALFRLTTRNDTRVIPWNGWSWNVIGSLWPHGPSSRSTTGGSTHVESARRRGTLPVRRRHDPARRRGGRRAADVRDPRGRRHHGLAGARAVRPDR